MMERQDGVDADWLIYFEDASMDVELIHTGEDSARARFSALQDNWNCHLFRRIPSPDEPPSAAPAPLPAGWTRFDENCVTCDRCETAYDVPTEHACWSVNRAPAPQEGLTLLPCPFCGGRAEMNSVHLTNPWFRVVCTNPECRAHDAPKIPHWSMESAARAAWNKRALREQPASESRPSQDSLIVSLRSIEAMIGMLDHSEAIDDEAALGDHVASKVSRLVDQIREQPARPRITREQVRAATEKGMLTAWNAASNINDAITDEILKLLGED